MNVRSVALLALLAIGPAAASAQTPSNPFLGSAPPPGPPSPQPVPLSLKDAVDARPAIQPRAAAAGSEQHTGARRALARARGPAAERLRHAQRAAHGDQPGRLSASRRIRRSSGRSTSSTRASPLSQPLIDLRALNDYARRGAQRARRGARHQVGTRSRRAGRRQPLSRGGGGREPDRRRSRAAGDGARRSSSRRPT